MGAVSGGLYGILARIDLVDDGPDEVHGATQMLWIVSARAGGSAGAAAVATPELAASGAVQARHDAQSDGSRGSAMPAGMPYRSVQRSVPCLRHRSSRNRARPTP